MKIDGAPELDVVRRDPVVARDAPEREDDCLRTRDAVIASLLEQGPQTAATLGDRLGLSPAGVRRHLDSLVGEGRVIARDQQPLGPRRRGRPAKVFVLTDAGRDRFPHAYDDLAAAALRFLAQTGGEDAVRAFATRRAEHMLAGVTGTRPTAEDLADELRGQGYAASSQPVSSGEQLCQHHCPVAHVAAEFPQLCEAETELFGQLLGTHVQRLATIARGDGVCTTHVPDPRRTAASGRTASSTNPTGTTRPDISAKESA
ncbi:MAG: helix-turn-helix transcriptional regulator [Mycobacteriales bacterium]